MKLSLIIPCYNEKKRLFENAKEVLAYLRNNFPEDFEIIVVDDGSSDDTRNVARELYGARLNEKRENRGKGFSVREGVMMAQGDLILVSDADFSTPISQLSVLREHISKFPIVIGSRSAKGAIVRTSMSKKILGRVSSIIISSFLFLGILDTQCGFKLFKKSVAREIFSFSRLDGFSFDFEILFIAKKRGYKVKEVGVEWVLNSESKVSFMDYPRTFAELLKVRRLGLLGVYNGRRRE